MRKSYPLGNQKEMAWGFDKTSGFFLQVFDESADDELLLENADQGNLITGFSIATEYLSYEKMTGILSENSKQAMAQFEDMVKNPLPSLYFGYLYNEEGYYNNKEQISTYQELFFFIDKLKNHMDTIKKTNSKNASYDLREVSKYLTVTDFLDMAVDLSEVVHDSFQHLKEMKAS